MKVPNGVSVCGMKVAHAGCTLLRHSPAAAVAAIQHPTSNKHCHARSHDQRQHLAPPAATSAPHPHLAVAVHRALQLAPPLALHVVKLQHVEGDDRDQQAGYPADDSLEDGLGVAGEDLQTGGGGGAVEVRTGMLAVAGGGISSQCEV